MSEIHDIIAQARMCGWRTPSAVSQLCDEVERLTIENAELRDRVEWLENPTYTSVPGKRREVEG